MGVWVCGCVGVWVCGYVGVYICMCVCGAWCVSGVMGVHGWLGDLGFMCAFVCVGVGCIGVWVGI